MSKDPRKRHLRGQSTLVRRQFIKRTPLKRRPRKVRRNEDPAYLDWIRTLPCVICLRDYPIQLGATEAAHIGQRGFAQKSSDRETIPLCGRHHRWGKDAHHVLGKHFFERHGLNREELIRSLNAAYEHNPNH